MAAKSISIPVTGNTAPLRSSLTRAQRDLQRFADKAKADMKRSAQAFGVAVVGAGLLASKMNGAYEAMATADARTLQITKSMGIFGAQAGAVSERLRKLARDTALNTGVDANAIKMTQAKLMTFRNLALTANEAGGAFDRATKAAIDMAAAGFGEASQNAVQLGKALQDPIKGVTALARSGITFNDVEKAKIRTLVESNRVLEAQDMVLRAIEMQVGGTAVATANASDKMREGMRIVKEEIGRGLAPAFESLAGTAVSFGNWAEKNGPVVAAVAVAFGLLTVAVTGVKVAMGLATAASAAFALAQTGLASANLAVQISTGVGIATAAIALGIIVATTAKVYANAKALREQAAATATVTEETGIMKNMIDANRKANEAAAAAEEKKAAANTKAAEAEKKRYAEVKQRMADAKQAIRDYVAEISRAINSQVNLGAAFSQANDEQATATERVNEALKERRDAYAVLQQAQATGDAKSYATALENVSQAEKNVTEAQAVKPKNYSAIFAEQIAAAKSFATYIGQLAKAGLSKAGLGQILDLGPVAGAQVAKDLLSGASGMTVASLNQDLTDIADTGTAAGMSIPGFSEALDSTLTRSGAGQYNITIQAGVSSPTDIAKTVTGVLNTYGATTGGVKVKVKRPKATTGRRR
jgi:hypothetical protein